MPEALSIQSRVLGRTGLSVCPLGLGTVELGMEYGIQAPGEFGRPADDEALTLLRDAADLGVDFFDTAPGYGRAEALLGEALGDQSGCVLATKVSVPRAADGTIARGGALRTAIMASVDESRRLLRCETLDVVQIHNATVEALAEGELAAALTACRSAGKVRVLGTSVYTEEEALASIEAGCFDVLQVAYNMLDQRMAGRVFPAAREAGVGLIVRSAFLKGALTAKSRHLPADLQPLSDAADRLRLALGAAWRDLPQLALRFCLSFTDVAVVIVGVRSREELDTAVTAAREGPLPPDALEVIAEHAITDDGLLNPAKWSGV